MPATTRAQLAVSSARVRLADERAISLVEMLVVTAILGVVLGGLTQLFVSASKSQVDQTNRVKAQLDGRVALNKLRREIHCASAVSPTTGFPVSSITITLGTYCPTSGGATTVTWCVKDKNGSAPPVAGATPYTLWRYVAASCAGTGQGQATGIVEATPVTLGKIFRTYTAPSGVQTLTTMNVDIPLRWGTSGHGLFRLTDDIALRNTPR
jgi:type II secretory pathway pseudopilin PulG